jgi:hypothetical protein
MLYGMPHIGAKYYREDAHCTKWTGDHRVCACCGKVGGGHSRHHEPPLGRGTSFVLRTPVGRFVLMPALIDLCGSGTTGCHGDRHNGRLAIRWEWDSDEYEARWWNGTFLKRGMKPNGQWLFDYGKYIFAKDGREWEVRL